MNVLDLFSGIGGFSLGLERAGMNTVAFCEIDPFCRRVLKKHWPDVPIFEDIKELHAEDITKPVDVVCGGFPCQPFSVSGQKRGKNDDRFLWPEMLRIVRENKPTWVIGENVANIINMGLEEMLFDLEAIDYRVETFVIPACAVNLPHRRDRVWVVAHSDSIVWPPGKTETGTCCEKILQTTEEWEQFFILNHGTNNIAFRKDSESEICRENDGFPRGLDEDRLRSLGNAVVPQIPEIIGRAIMSIEAMSD